MVSYPIDPSSGSCVVTLCAVENIRGSKGCMARILDCASTPKRKLNVRSTYT